MLNDSLLDSFKRFRKLVVFSLVVFGVFAGGLIVPGFLFLSQLSQVLSLGVSWVLDKLLVLKFVFGLVDEGFEFVFCLGEVSFLLLRLLVSFEHLLCPFVQFFLFAFYVEWLAASHVLFILFGHRFVLFDCFVLNLLLFLLFVALFALVRRLLSFNFVIGRILSLFWIFFFFLHWFCWGLFLTLWILRWFFLVWIILGFWFWDFFHVWLDFVLLVVELAVFQLHHFQRIDREN